MTTDEMSIRVTENGPYEVVGAVPLALQSIVADAEAYSVAWQQGAAIEAPAAYRLCRCGQSGNKPFCDDSHLRLGFDGTETASREPYLEQAEEITGPVVILTDAQDLCAFARFCDSGGGVWSLAQRADPEATALAVRQATHCPSGRLVTWDSRTLEPFEPSLEPSIGVVQDPPAGVSGPLWVRGGIPVIAADGHRYEVRNRVTLCRCGASDNKPFCNGSHAAIDFKDGLTELPPRSF